MKLNFVPAVLLSLVFTVLGFSCTTPLQENILATSVTLSPSVLELAEEESAPLTVTILPRNAIDKSIAWMSSNESVATVTTDGIVEAHSIGTAYISAINQASGKSATCEVSVTSKPGVVSISLDKTTCKLAIFSGHLKVSPEELPFCKVTVYYSDKEQFNINNAKHISVTEFDTDNSFEMPISGLKHSTIYHYCVLVEVKDQKYYGDVESFTTPDIIATITAEATDVKCKTVTISAKLTIESEGQFNKENARLYYSTTVKTVDELISQGKYSSLTLESDGSYRTKLMNLIPNTKHYYVVMYTVDDTYPHTEVKEFTTLPITATITAYASDVSDHSVTIYGDLIVPPTSEIFYGRITLYYSAAPTMVTADELEVYGIKKSVSHDPHGYYSISLKSLNPCTKYYFFVMSSLDDTYQQTEVKTFTTLGNYIGNAIDLGLSVKWADCNIGASRPEEFGGYYAWGEVDSKENYSWDTYKWSEGDFLTKYCYDADYGIVDNKTVLEIDDDVAHAKIGGGWHIPNDADWEELLNEDNCSWTYTGNYNGTGVRGFLVESKKPGFTDNHIFLPAAGYRSLENDTSMGYYWSSNIFPVDTPSVAFCMHLVGPTVEWYGVPRSFGLSVRPVTK